MGIVFKIHKQTNHIASTERHLKNPSAERLGVLLDVIFCVRGHPAASFRLQSSQSDPVGMQAPSLSSEPLGLTVSCLKIIHLWLNARSGLPLHPLKVLYLCTPPGNFIGLGQHCSSPWLMLWISFIFLLVLWLHLFPHIAPPRSNPYQSNFVYFGFFYAHQV